MAAAREFALRTGCRGRLLALLLASVGPGCAPAPGDVLLVVVDTLRGDRLSLTGYPRETTPHIDHWFADGAIYLRAYSTEASTAPSVASILSGRLPQDHGVRLFYQLLPEEVEIVPDLLPAEYQTAGFVSNVVLTDEALGLADRFDRFDDFVDERESKRVVFERRAERTTDAALAWLAQADPERPVFLFVHYIDPHGPYRAPGRWRRRFRSESRRPIPTESVPEYTRVQGIDDGNDYVARYDSEVAYVDAAIGRLLEGFAARRSVDDALMILTADHGESMMEHERFFTHGYHVYDEIVRVPLLLRGPGVEAGPVRVPASGVDVAGTILAFAGVDVPGEVAPTDLRRPSELDPERIVFAEAGRKTGQYRAALGGDRKAVVFVRPAGTIGRRKVYDLASDPGEHDPRLLPPGDPLARALQEKVERDPDPSGRPLRYRKGIKIGAPKVAPGVSAADLERLRKLGYAE